MIEKRNVESQNIEHQQISVKKSVSEYQNKTSTGTPQIFNVRQIENRLDMSFNGKYYYNKKLTSIVKNKECGFSHDCLRIAMNVMFTKMADNNVFELFKDHTAASIVN